MTGVPEPTQRRPVLPADASGGEVLYCRICRRALTTQFNATGTVTLRHAQELRGGAVDHSPKPVPVTEMPDPLMECDFCSAPEAAWAYVCADQYTHVKTVTTKVVDALDYRDRHHAARTRRTDTENAYTSMWGQRWSACQGCAALIENRDLYGLISRVTDSLPRKYTSGKRLIRVRGELHGVYSHLFDTLAPGRGRITPGQPLGVWEPPGAPS